MSEKVLELNNLAVSFNTPEGEVEAVRGVDLSVKAGEILCVVGESGCGKTVMCQSVMHLLPPYAYIKHGTMSVCGQDITNYTEKQMRKLRGSVVSMVFQDPLATLNPTIPIGKQITEAILKHQKVTKAAAKGGWESAKGYVYAAIILFVLGLCVRTCASTQNNHDFSYNAQQNEPSLLKPSTASSEPVSTIEAFQEPDTWKKYYLANHAFSISVPPIVELRHDYDQYVKRIQGLGLSCNTEDVVFQQKDLANNSPEALARYCRIIIQHFMGNVDEFPLPNETFLLDSDTRTEFREIVEKESEPFKLIGAPSYKWISIKDAQAIEISYRRTGSDKYTTACKMYLLFNSSQMVKMIVSYREQERDIWLPDLTNVIKTFRWVQ